MTETAALTGSSHVATSSHGTAEGAAHATAEHAVAQAPENPFDKDDLAEFKEADREAAGNIGKMLTAFFFYSLLAMGCVSVWAYLVTR